jgi:hypothetical protein
MDVTGDHVKWDKPDSEKLSSSLKPIRKKKIIRGGCGDRRMQWGEYLWSKYIVYMHENVIMKPIIFAQLIYSNKKT